VTSASSSRSEACPFFIFECNLPAYLQLIGEIRIDSFHPHRVAGLPLPFAAICSGSAISAKQRFTKPSCSPFSSAIRLWIAKCRRWQLDSVATLTPLHEEMSANFVQPIISLLEKQVEVE
jgi:hypothetical protein